MARTSAGLLMYRTRGSILEVLLAHYGGPLWKNRDEGAWSIPKGELQDGEAPLAAAVREFREETGLTAEGPFVELGTIRQKSGKTVHAWAVRGDAEPTQVGGGLVRMEWPKRSGRYVEFQEIDRAAFFSLDQARQKINAAQAALLDRLEAAVRGMRPT